MAVDTLGSVDDKEKEKNGDNFLRDKTEDAPNLVKKLCQKLSHKQWRRLWKKEKRRKLRQQIAKTCELKEKEELIQSGLTSSEAIEAKQKQDEWQEFLEQKKRQKLHEEWIAKEKLAQEEFDKNKKDEERRKQERISQDKRIKEEWENQQKKEKLASERKEQAVKDRESKLTKVLEKSGIIKSTKDEEEWHNPIIGTPGAPKNPKLYGTEQDPNNCSFYLKTGACRFGERCSRLHPRPECSVTLLIPNMFQDVRLTEVMLDEKDQDVGLEFDEAELYQNFKEFYKDVLGEFKTFGEIVQFKVCNNFEPHLRGNVYVQFRREEDALSAFARFNARWYAGRQLSVQFSPVTKWKSAICGTFARNRCPRGKNCNFLHVFSNPNNEFRDADRDCDSTRKRQPSTRRSEREWRSSTRELERRWERADSQYSDRSNYRRERSQRRDNLAARGSRTRSRERYRAGSRSPKHYRSPSNSRDRSKLKSRHYKQRSRSRERSSRSRAIPERSRSRNRSREKNRSRSRSASLERKTRHHKRRRQTSSSSSSCSGDENVKKNNSKKASRIPKPSSRNFKMVPCSTVNDTEDIFEPEVDSD